MWSLVQDAPSFVQFFMLIGCLLMGLSHVIRPKMWAEYFTYLQAQGTRGVITRSFTFDLWPALLTVTLHQVWQGPAVIVTIFGWLLLAKVALAMIAPELGLRSLAVASNDSSRRFVSAGCALIGIGVCAGAALFHLP